MSKSPIPATRAHVGPYHKSRLPGDSQRNFGQGCLSRFLSRALLVERQGPEGFHATVPKARTENFRFGNFLIPVTDSLTSRSVHGRMTQSIARFSGIIPTQLVIGQNLRKYIILCNSPQMEGFGLKHPTRSRWTSIGLIFL